MEKLALELKVGGPCLGLESGGGCGGLGFGSKTSPGPTEEPPVPSRSSSVEGRSCWRRGPKGTQLQLRFRRSVPVAKHGSWIGRQGGYPGRRCHLAELGHWLQRWVEPGTLAMGLSGLSASSARGMGTA